MLVPGRVNQPRFIAGDWDLNELGNVMPSKAGFGWRSRALHHLLLAHSGGGTWGSMLGARRCGFVGWPVGRLAGLFRFGKNTIRASKDLFRGRVQSPADRQVGRGPAWLGW
jgi:hypothetical protein